MKKIPNQTYGTCFACGQSNHHGLKLIFYTDDKQVYTNFQVPVHLAGWSNLVHGGIITTVLDETIAWTGIFLLQKYMLTKNIHVEFLKPVRVGQELYSAGLIEEKKTERDIKISSRIYDSEGTVLARGLGEIKVFSPEFFRKMGVVSEEYLNSFEQEVFGRTLNC